MATTDDHPAAVEAPARNAHRMTEPPGLDDNDHAAPPAGEEPQPGQGVDYPDPGIPPDYEGEI